MTTPRQERGSRVLTRGGCLQKSRPTHNKRARERARLEKQQLKAARRLENKARKSSSPAARGDEDPDIAGIVPGPQPSPWGDDNDDTPDEDAKADDEPWRP